MKKRTIKRKDKINKKRIKALERGFLMADRDNYDTEREELALINAGYSINN